MGFWRSLFGAEPVAGEAPRRCPHDLIRAHTTAETYGKERIVIATCLDCGESVTFKLGRVVEEMVSQVTTDVLQAKGYRRDPEKSMVWLRGDARN